LLRLHHEDPVPKVAYAIADLERLAWAWNTATGEDKNARYKAALESFIKRYADLDISALASEHEARLLMQEGEMRAAHELADRAAKQFPNELAIQGPGAGLFLNFDTSENQSVELKLAMSYTSIANARLNLEREAKDLNFDAARTKAQTAWSDMLGRIQVSGGKEEDRVKFYTGLYHALLGRGLASDVNGAYRKNDDSIGQIPVDANGMPKYNHYNSDAVWGAFWNLTQLWALAYPDYFSEFVECHLDIARDCGWLPD